MLFRPFVNWFDFSISVFAHYVVVDFLLQICLFILHFYYQNLQLVPANFEQAFVIIQFAGRLILEIDLAD
jgi:hypothetical protein